MGRAAVSGRRAVQTHEGNFSKKGKSEIGASVSRRRQLGPSKA